MFVILTSFSIFNQPPQMLRNNRSYDNILCSKSKQFRSVVGKFQVSEDTKSDILLSQQVIFFHFFMWPYLGILCTFLQ